MKGQFTVELALLDHRKANLDLGFTTDTTPTFDSNVDDLQAEFDRIERWKEEYFVQVQEMGHGIRSMLRVLASLLEPTNQVILIDEPEMHLYPSQKRWLGRELVRLARDLDKQVFIVTHDPVVLQGILDMPSSTTLFRLDFGEGSTRYVRECTLEHLEDMGAQRNQVSYLQGLFYQRCIVVEGASDRAFYQTMVEEEYPVTSDKDLGFVACGGKGGTKNVAYIASKVGLRSAFIYDFDALVFDLPLIEDVFVSMGGMVEDLLELRQFVERFGLPDVARRSGETYTHIHTHTHENNTHTQEYQTHTHTHKHT